MAQQSAPTELLTGDYLRDIQTLNERLRVSKSFDLVVRNIRIGESRGRLYFVDGFVKDEVMEKILEFLMSADPEVLHGLGTSEAFSDRFVPYVETSLTQELGAVITQVLSGTIALIAEGYDRAIMIDARTYPARGVTEPEDDRVLRGSRDGFVETVVMNTALIRRRIRDPGLTMKILQVGGESKTDIVLCYLEQKVNPKILKSVEERIQNIEVRTLTMAQESLAECLIRKQWYNPFPRVRYTERPDCAAANVVEGKIAVIVDNSPAVMILPTSIFDYVQDTNDFYFPPLVGTYLRLVRLLIFLLTIFLTPVWFLLVQNPQWIPPWLDFIKISEPNTVPVIFQLLITEFVLDGLRLASLNTPSVLSNSFSVVSALILGDFAVQAKWLVPETVLYMAFVALGNFTQPSFELGYAFKLWRMLILVFTALFNLWGFIGAIVLMLLVLAFTKSITGASYLFPLIPFNGRAFLSLFVRRPINRRNT